MKKIFALVLALSMVLSMGMASANLDCLNIDWTTTTNCGMGSVEVVPYVISNGANGQVVYTANDCAGAVNSQYIYYAIKVTVDANPNQEWWDLAELRVTFGDGIGSVDGNAVAGNNRMAVNRIQNPIQPIWGNTTGANSNGTIDNTYWTGATTDGLDAAIALANGDSVADHNVKAGTYYLSRDANNKAFTISTSFNPNNNLFFSTVANVHQAVEVTARLRSTAELKWQGFAGADDVTGATVTDYTNSIYINGYDVSLVKYAAGTVSINGEDATYGITLRDGSKAVIIMFNGSKFIGVHATDGTTEVALHSYGTSYAGVEEYTGVYLNSVNANDSTSINANCANSAIFNLVKSAMAAINVPWGAPIKEGLALDKLRWTGTFSDIGTWGSAATAIVDTNCVIEIPKTGDVSVVAYAVMALVTAAGALKFRK